MSRRIHIVALAALCALPSVAVIVAAEQRPTRVTDRQVGDLVKRLDVSVAAFRASFDRTIGRSRMKGDRAELTQSVKDFQRATERVGEGARNRREGGNDDVEDVLRRASSIDQAMASNTLDAAVERDWGNLRPILDELARAYNVSADWTNPPGTAGRDRSGINQRLTGTYQRDGSRGEDSDEAVRQATRRLPVKQRQAASQRLTNRLHAPETIAIARNQNSVTMASSRGRKVTFEADGQVRREQGSGGRSMSTRATLNGDQLLVTTTGNRGNDFAVTFEPIDNGSTLRVTRRIEDDSIRQPVSVVSFYKKTSDEARWDIDSDYERAPSRTGPSPDDLGVPDGTRLIGTLDTALNTRTASGEDRFTITIRSPSAYEGAVVEGTVASVNASGRVSGRAEMALNLERIRLRNGRTHQFSGVIEHVRTANGETIDVNNEGKVADDSQTEKTVQRGAIGAALGAIIGAISGGGQGAAIGAAIGAGGGAGTVIVQGRDQLDLARGTEFTIVSGRPGNQRTSTNRDR